MEEFLIFSAVLERLETSPFEAALNAGDDDPIVARSREATLQFMRTFMGSQAVEALWNEGSPPRWLEELIAADATDALEREWLISADFEDFLKVMPWTRRLVPRLDEFGNPPPTTKCLLVPGKFHHIPPGLQEKDLSEAIAAQREDIIRSAIDARDAPDVIEGARRTRQYWHAMRRMSAVDGVPCAALWRAYTCAKRQSRPWATYLRSEWGVDLAQPIAAQPTREGEDELHYGLVVVALSTIGWAAALVRAVERPFSDPISDNPCAEADQAVRQVFNNGWIYDARLMRAAPLAGQRAMAGLNLAAHVLTKVSLGHSRTPTAVRGRPGKRLDAALHEIGHDDPTIPCSRAHDTALIRELLALVWTEPIVEQITSVGYSADPGYEVLLRRLANKLTNNITRRARARRRRQTADGVTISEGREVGLAFDPGEMPLDPLEEFLAREEAERAQRLWQECLELIPLLPPRQRAVAELKLIDRLSHPQIAVHLGITEGGSKANWSKARKNLLHLFRQRQEQFGDVA